MWFWKKKRTKMEQFYKKESIPERGVPIEEIKRSCKTIGDLQELNNTYLSISSMHLGNLSA